MTRAKLTARQAEILKFIRSFSRSNGFPPTRREIGAYFGWAGASAAHQHLQLIAAKGYIETGRSPRSIRLLDKR